MGSSLKGKNLLLEEQILSCYELTNFREGGQKIQITETVALHESGLDKYHNYAKVSAKNHTPRVYASIRSRSVS